MTDLEKEELETYRMYSENGQIAAYYLLAEELGVNPNGSVVDTVTAITKERDRYMRALVHIRSNAESMLRAHETCARIAGEFVETPEFINARWNYTEANSALNP